MDIVYEYVDHLRAASCVTKLDLLQVDWQVPLTPMA